MRILKVVPKENFRLHILADDGQIGVFDVQPYFHSDAFSPLRDLGEFKRIHNRHYFIEWDCGADLSADTIEAHWELTSSGRNNLPVEVSAPNAGV